MSSLTIITMPWLKKERKIDEQFAWDDFRLTTLRDVSQLHKVPGVALQLKRGRKQVNRLIIQRLCMAEISRNTETVKMLQNRL